MTSKEYLERIQLLDEFISQKKWELEDIERKRTLISAIDYSKGRFSGSKSGEAPFVKTSDKLADLEREINREIEDFSAERHRVINLIQGLKNCNFVKILYKRYVEYKTLEDIACEMNYTYRHIRDLHLQALENFEKTYTISS